MSATQGGTSRRLRLAVVALGSLVLALEAYAIARVLEDVGKVFPGFIVSRELVVTQLNQPYWSGIRAGLRPGDLVVAVDGQPVRSSWELIEWVRETPERADIEYTIARGGRTVDLTIRSAVFRPGDFFSTFGILAVTAVGFLLVGSVVVWLRRGDLLGTGVYAFCFSVAFAMGVSPDLSWARELPLSKLWHPLLVAGILHLALVFPEPGALLQRHRWILATPWVGMLPLAALNLGLLPETRRLTIAIERLNRWATFGAALTLLAAVLLAFWRSAPQAEPGRSKPSSRRLVRERVRITLGGLFLAIVCYAVGFLGAEFGFVPSAPASMFVLPAWIWFGTIALASLRDDVFDLGTEAREALVGPAVFGMTMILYLLLFGAAVLVFRRIGVSWGWVFPLAFLMIAVVLVDPIRRAARAAVAWAMNTAILLPPRVLRDLSGEVASSLDEQAIERAVASISEHLGLTSVRLFLAGPDGWTEANRSTRLAPDHPFAVILERSSGIVLGRMHDLGEEDRELCRETMEPLGIASAFPLRFRGRCMGFIGFGHPARGGSMAAEDVVGLSALAGQIAVTLENARVLQRIRELETELRAENVVLREALAAAPGLEGLVGRSATMRRVYDLVEQVAPTDATVLIRGETGTGKELVARAIHARSLRRDRPMIRLSCAAVPPTLLESELFGHERGAFTGALGRKVGRFELAAGGTIFLDEIGDLPAELQPKLLRVLQEREFERIGGIETLRADVRVIAATNRDLDALVRRGQFREDLFFRLNVFPIAVPPLRERREDISVLVAHFLHRYAARMQKPVVSIEERSLRALVAYHWPGNVRELENLIERAMVLSNGGPLVIRDVEMPEVDETARGSLRPLSEILREIKVQTIRRALSETEGNQAHAAALLGMKPSSLSRMIKSLGLRA